MRFAAACQIAMFTAMAQAPDEGGAIFQKHIAPVLQAKCAACHEKQKISGLGTGSREELLKGGNRGPAIKPGSPKDSLLIAALEHSGDVKMPPGGRLPVETIAAFKRWIELGAPWATGAVTSGPITAPDDTWAFRPVTKPAVPAGARNPIDAFIGRTLAGRNLSPAPKTDRRTLIRRATFDLWGLPPTPEQVENFVNDKSPDAWEKVVDRLLASPHYGERQARHWLDVVRYADTGGFSNDFERPNAWRYREYVIRAMNADKPYSDFILEQIAGDELSPAGSEKLAATGFLRMGPWEHTAMSVAAVTRQEWLDDVTHITAAAFLGVTLECARCHDHKFDPIPTKDYYRIQAAFAATEFAERKAPFLPDEKRDDFAIGRERLNLQAKQNSERMAAYDAIARKRLMEKLGAKNESEVPPDKLKAALRTHDTLEPEEFEGFKIFQKRQELYRRSSTRYDELAYSVDNTKEQPQETFILPVGNLQTPGEKVTPGVLSAASLDGSTDVPTTVSGRRLALARWIASSKNPLTARVMVNRIWQTHFGIGIVGTPNDFGKLGKRPSHPELLDWLAATFVESGWRMKPLHRVILLSDTYQRASAVTPEPSLLSHFPPRRLEAETIRDSILFVAGELSADTGGPGSLPEINEDIAVQPVQIMGTLMPAYRPSPEKAKRHRRSIYSFQKRNLTDPMLDVLNGPSLSESTPKRDATTIPTQAFALFNSRFVNDMALAFANRVASAADPIAELYRRAYNRPPAQEEKRLLNAQWNLRIARYTKRPAAPPPQPKPLMRSITSELTGAEVMVEEDELPVPYEHNLRAADVSPRVRALADLALVIFNSNEFIYLY